MGLKVFNSLLTYIKDISCNVKEFKSLSILFFQILFICWRSISNIIIHSILIIAYIPLYYLIKQYSKVAFDFFCISGSLVVPTVDHLNMDKYE